MVTIATLFHYYHYTILYTNVYLVAVLYIAYSYCSCVRDNSMNAFLVCYANTLVNDKVIKSDTPPITRVYFPIDQLLQQTKYSSFDRDFAVQLFGLFWSLVRLNQLF
jgi:hypothetical protein